VTLYIKSPLDIVL